MQSRHMNSFRNWCLTGTFASSLILGGSVLSQAGPLRPLGKSSSKAPAQTELQKQIVERKLAAAEAESQQTITAEESEAKAEARISKSAKRVQLNFLEASWKTVITKYAEQVGAELVAEPGLIPTARFTRRDRSQYTAEDALKILNRELQQYDVKLVMKARHVVLMEITAAAPNYKRPELRGTELVASHELPPSRIKPAFPDRKQPRQIRDEEVTDARAVPISTESGDVGSQRIQQASATAPAVEIDPRGLPLVPVTIRNRRSKDVANALYRAFKQNCEMVNDGPEGLPAIRVYDPAPKTKSVVGKMPLAAPKRTLRFTLAIDHDRGQLLIEAPRPMARSLATVIRKLDAPTEGGASVQLFASEKYDQVETMAELVQTQLEELAKARRKAPSLDQAVALQGDNLPLEETSGDAQVDGQPAEGDTAQQPPANNPPAAGNKAQLPDLLGGLKGDVSVESVPDLGVMILRGNQKDVDAVMGIIREIEKLSAGTAPDVHLLLLKNTNSESLAELLSQVYERLNGRRQRGPGNNQAANATPQVTVIPVVKPNAILIVAAAADMESILKLAEELDQPVDPSAEFQMFRLKSAVAAQVLETIQTFYEERKGLGARVLAVADVRTNSVLVHARPRDLAEVATLVKELDQGTTAAVSQMKIFPLKNAVAVELADVLQQSLQSILNAPTRAGTGQGGQGGLGGGAGAAAGGGQGGAALRDVKSTVLQFLSADGPGERLLQSGILADIRVTADGRTNSLVVTAPEESMTILEELIRQLDRQTSTVAEIKVFSLQNSDAKSMITLLESLFANPAAQQNALDRLGVQVAGAEDASSGLVPLKFSVDSRTNSIVAVGAADALRVVEAILIRLDESEVRQRQSIVFRLKNSPATDVATAVNNFLTSRRDLEQSSDGLVSPFEQIEREVIVVAEPISNTLLISATPRYFKEIQQLVINLDAAPQQVTIQALLVEVTLDNTDEFGVELGLQDSVLFRRSVVPQSGITTLTQTTTQNNTQTTNQQLISQTGVPGFLFNNQQLGNNTNGVGSNPGYVGKQGLTNFSLGRQNNELGYGGLVLAAGSESVSVLLRALAATRRVDILSRPQIRTLDNQLAIIQVGQEVPVVNGFTPSALGANPVVEVRNAGIILQVVPRISPDGRVVMDVAAERSTYLPDDQGVTIFSDPSTGQIIRAPKKDISTARASVAVANEQTVVLGGMISSQNTNSQRKVPFLGDLPFLGLPFRYSLTQSTKRELLIFLTPRVIRTDADSELIKQVETARIHFMEEDAEEIHGPIMSAPAPIEPYDPNQAPIAVPPLVDDPSVPTTQMQPIPGPSIGVPPPPAPDGQKLMLRGNTSKRSARVALK
ncbi:MAG: secretin N-terminal domain-containing protein [Planctomycetota bacterium]